MANNSQVFGGKVQTITDLYEPPLAPSKGYPCGSVVSMGFFCKAHSDGLNAPVVRPLPANWEVFDLFPIHVGYFEDLFRQEYWAYVRQFGTEATKLGPRTVGRRYRRGTTGGTQTGWSDNYEVPSYLDIMLHSNMTVEEENASRLENFRRERARRIIDSLGGTQDKMVAPNLDAIDPLGFNDPGVPPNKMDSNHYFIRGATFDGLSSISTESNNSEKLPACPQYELIRRYLLSNRAQGRLCLDTMDFSMPAYTMLKYIQDFGGLNITPEEWIAFLRNCDDRNETFMYVLWESSCYIHAPSFNSY